MRVCFLRGLLDFGLCHPVTTIPDVLSDCRREQSRLLAYYTFNVGNHMIKIIDLFRTLLAIIAKYGFLISLRYVLLEMFINKILL